MEKQLKEFHREEYALDYDSPYSIEEIQRIVGDYIVRHASILIDMVEWKLLVTRDEEMYSDSAYPRFSIVFYRMETDDEVIAREIKLEAIRLKAEQFRNRANDPEFQKYLELQRKFN